MKIAFASIGNSDGWTGGGYYFRNLLTVLRGLDPDERPHLVLAHESSGAAGSHGMLRDLVDEELVFNENQHRRLFTLVSRSVNYLHRHIRTGSDRYGDFLRRNDVECIFGLNQLRPNHGCAVASWIPDFQHVHLPEYFPESERRRREMLHVQTASRADVVVVSSNDAFADLLATHPQVGGKGMVLNFVSQLPDNVFDVDPTLTCLRYRLPERFFLLPNQFWRHKNHVTVFQAIEIAKKKVPGICVVCTGNPNDYRSPQHFSYLLQQISQMGIRDNVIQLGLVPKADMFQLMRQSLAAIQPSLFEGWSTTVEESKSLGKRMIVSDLAVHREQAPEQSEYFAKADAAQLARIMIVMAKETPSGPDVEMETAARGALRGRTQAFARRFIEICKEAKRRADNQ